jgi:hypothetical protein
MDRVYFDSPIAPGDEDWLHCDVLNTKDGMLRVRVRIGFQETQMAFPMARVQRIVYDSRG